MGIFKRSALTAAVAGVTFMAGSAFGQAAPAGQAQPHQQQSMQQPMQQQHQQQAQQQYQQIAPFITQQTFGVVSIDLSRIDLTQTEQWLGQVMQMMEKQPAEQQARQQQLQTQTQLARNWVNSLRQAGAEHIILAGHIQGEAPSWALIVPLKQGANQQQITQLLTARAPAGAVAPQTATLHNAVVLAPQQAMESLRQNQPAKLPFDQALNATGNAPVQVTFVPQQKLSTWFNSAVAPKLSPAVMQGNLQNFPEKMEWMAVALGPDQPTRVVFNATDAQVAQQMAQTLDKILAQAQIQTQAQTQNDQVAVQLSTDQVNKLIAADVAPVLKAAEFPQQPGMQGQQPGMQPGQQPRMQPGQQPGQQPHGEQPMGQQPNYAPQR